MSKERLPVIDNTMSSGLGTSNDGGQDRQRIVGTSGLGEDIDRRDSQCSSGRWDALWCGS